MKVLISRKAPYYALLLVEVLIFHRHILFRSGYQLPWDFRTVHLPLATFVADSFRRGEFPLWDPYTYCGNPIYANIQTALFYPPVLVATLTSLLFAPAALAWLLEAAMVLQIFFAGICTFALLQRLGIRPAAAWIGGTMYELGCFFASQAEHMGAIHAATWLPLAWLCVVVLRTSFQWRWVAALSVALAMSILAGLPQVAVAVFGSTVCFAVVVAAFRLGRWILPLQVLMACLWALLLAAVQLIPTVELTRNSVAKFRAEWLGTGGGIKLGALFSLPIPDYWNVFDLSKFQGPSDPTFLYLYSSILGLILILIALCWEPDRWTAIFALLMMGAATWMLGDSTSIGHSIFTSLPVSIRIGIHPEFTMCVFALTVAILAGLGANRVLHRTRLQVAAGVVIACDLILVSSGRPMNAAPVSKAPDEIITTLRELSAASFPPSRFDMTPSVSLEWSSTAPLIRIPTANGCDPMAPERVIQVRLSFAPGERWGTCYQAVNSSSPVLRLINDRHLLSQTPIDGMTPASEQNGLKIYKVKDALPRFFFVNEVRTVSNLAEAAQTLHSESFNPSQFAIVEEPVPGDLGGGNVEVLSYRPRSITLQTHSATPAFLVATDTHYPGWEVKIDGQPAHLYIADVAFRGIRVQAGDHRVEMRFVPRILYVAATLSGLAFVVLLWGAGLWPAKPVAVPPS